MQRQLSVLMIALVLALASGQVLAQDLKVGVVNVAQLVSQSPQAQKARSSMEEQFSARREELEAKREQLQSDGERLKRDGAVMSDEARQTLEDSVRGQQRRLQLLQSEYNDDVRRAEQQELQSLREDIQEVIQSVATEGEYDLILGDSTLYASDQVDITQSVLERLQALNN